MPDSLIQDVRYTARTLAKSAGFSLTAILTLAIGIGAATAIFSMVNRVLVQRLPMANGDRLVHLRQPSTRSTDEGRSALGSGGFAPRQPCVQRRRRIPHVDVPALHTRRSDNSIVVPRLLWKDARSDGIANLEKACLRQGRRSRGLTACRVTTGATDDRTDAHQENAGSYDHLLDMATVYSALRCGQAFSHRLTKRPPASVGWNLSLGDSSRMLPWNRHDNNLRGNSEQRVESCDLLVGGGPAREFTSPLGFEKRRARADVP